MINWRPTALLKRSPEWICLSACFLSLQAVRDSRRSDSSGSMAVQPHTAGETVWKEHLSIPEFTCHDVCIQCQVAIQTSCIQKFLIYFTMHWWVKCTFSCSCVSVIVTLLKCVTPLLFLSLHFTALMHCGSQLACPNSWGATWVHACYATEAACTFQCSRHITAKLTGEPLTQNGNNDELQYEAGVPHRTHIRDVREWIHTMARLLVFF